MYLKAATTNTTVKTITTPKVAATTITTSNVPNSSNKYTVTIIAT